MRRDEKRCLVYAVMTAFVRVCGPPDSAFLVGYPDISATLMSGSLLRRCVSRVESLRSPGVKAVLTLQSIQPRIEGKVEIRRTIDISVPVFVSLVTISLQRCETIHSSADPATLAEKYMYSYLA